MQKLYKKSELIVSIVLIVIYVVGASAGDSLSLTIGHPKSLTLMFFIIFSAFILHFLTKEKLLKKYGLCKTAIHPKKLLYFIPLMFLCALNIVTGISITKTEPAIVIEVLSMLFVGFLEEIIFRGFLFKAMAKNNLKSVVIVSSLTFGIGHIVNLINGAQIVPTLCQIVGATGFGFMCVIIFIKSKSLLPCIITHSVFNMLSLFTSETEMVTDIIISAAMLVVTVGYAMILCFSNKQDTNLQK